LEITSKKTHHNLNLYIFLCSPSPTPRINYFTRNGNIFTFTIRIKALQLIRTQPYGSRSTCNSHFDSLFRTLLFDKQHWQRIKNIPFYTDYYWKRIFYYTVAVLDIATFCDMIAKFYLSLRIFFKKGDAFEEEFYTEDIIREGVFYNKLECTQGYTFFKRENEPSVQNF